MYVFFFAHAHHVISWYRIQNTFIWSRFRHGCYFFMSWFIFILGVKVHSEKVPSFDRQPLNRGALCVWHGNMIRKRANCRAAQSIFQMCSKCRWRSGLSRAHRMKVLLLMVSMCECEAHTSLLSLFLLKPGFKMAALQRAGSKLFCIVLVLTPQIISKDLGRLHLHFRLQVTQFHFFSPLFLAPTKCAAFWTLSRNKTQKTLVAAGSVSYLFCVYKYKLDQRLSGQIFPDVAGWMPLKMQITAARSHTSIGPLFFLFCLKDPLCEV